MNRMERKLTYFEAAEWRDLGFTTTQLTFEATSLHTAELYRIGVAAPAAIEPEPTPATTRVIEGSWDDVFAPIESNDPIIAQVSE